MESFCNCVYAAAAREVSEAIETPTGQELNGVQVFTSKVCWSKDNPDLELVEPNLLKLERGIYQRKLDKR